VRTRALVPLATLLSVLGLCTVARPASAQIYLRLDASTQPQGTYAKKLNLGVGQKVFIRLTALNATNTAVPCLCEVPGLQVRVNNTLQPYRIQSVLLPGRQGSTTVAAVASKAGTVKLTAILLYRNPATLQVNEVDDSMLLVVGDETTGGTGDKKDDKGGQLGDKKGDTGNLGGQTGGTGGQTGGTGGQLGTGGETGNTGGQLGTGGQTGGQQGGQLGGKKGDQLGGQQGGQLGGQQGGTGNLGNDANYRF